MSGFIRVRAVTGPLHEFDAPTGEVEANPELYKVLDETVVDAPRPPTYVVDEPTKPVAASPKQSVGDNTKENSHGD